MKRRFSGSTLNSHTEESSKSQINAGMGQRESSESPAASGDFETISDKFTGMVPDVPLAVVEEILLNLPAHQLVQMSRLGFREWKKLVDSAEHWKERCRREGIQPWDDSRPPENWCQFYLITKNQRNLIKNPKAEDGFSEWEIVENGGDLWGLENNYVKIPNHTVSKCFVTSYLLCLKQQLIDLQKEGYSAAFMDHLQPPIKISDWYGPRNDCGCVYHICVELLDRKKKPISRFEPEPVYFPQWSPTHGCEMTHVFKNYGLGVRFIRFTHGGKDTKFWAGRYGIRVTNSSVEICPAQARAQFTGVVPDVPLAVVEEIFLNLPAHQVVRVCRLVCREWKKLVDSAAHWKERCRREGIQPLDGLENWCQFYFITKKRHNLIKNPKAEDGFNGWKIVENGGDLWGLENNYVKIPNHTVSKCFVTSYRLCLKQQLIDLQKEGYSAAFMDHLQPPIKISDWYGPRNDCGCVYQICVELLNRKKKPISRFEPELVSFPAWSDTKGCEMTHVFKNYGPGVRFIRFTHGGKDTQFWAGRYGIRVTNSSVEICPAAERC